MAKEFYDVLGLTPDATAEDVRKAYKKRALATHPDRNPKLAKDVAEEGFRKVNNAYEVLSDPEKRKAYDQYGTWPPPPATTVPPSSSFGFSDPPFGPGFSFSSTQYDSRSRSQTPAAGQAPPGPSPFGDPFFHHGHPLGSPFPAGQSPFDLLREFHPYGHPSNSPFFGLHDPFEVFNTVFGADSPFGSSPFGVPLRSPPPPPASSLFGGFPGPFFPNSPLQHSHFMGQSASFVPHGNPSIGMFPPGAQYIDPVIPAHSNSSWGNFQTQSFQSSDRGTGGTRFTSTSTSTSSSTTKVTRIVDGMKTTEETTQDPDGNVHLVITFPDGSQRYQVNGKDRSPGEIQNIPNIISGATSSSGRKKGVIPRKVTLDDPMPSINDVVPPLPTPPLEDDEYIPGNPVYPGGYAPFWKDSTTHETQSRKQQHASPYQDSQHHGYHPDDGQQSHPSHDNRWRVDDEDELMREEQMAQRQLQFEMEKRYAQARQDLEAQEWMETQRREKAQREKKMAERREREDWEAKGRQRGWMRGVQDDRDEEEMDVGDVKDRAGHSRRSSGGRWPWSRR